MKKLLWLDDVRNPFENDWLNFSPIGKNVEVHWVKSYDDFIKALGKDLCIDPAPYYNKRRFKRSECIFIERRLK